MGQSSPPLNKVAVVGGAGFIGSRLVDRLGEAMVIDRSASEEPEHSFRVDVRDREGMLRALEGSDTVYLLAAEHADNVEPTSLYREVNVGGTQNIVHAALRHDIRRIIFTSSVAVYGLDAPGASEETSADPFNDYARSKWQAEQELVAWATGDDPRTLVIIRPSVVFGEGNRGNVYNLLRQVHSRRFVRVGSGRNRKSMAYVGNLVDFMARLTDAPSGIQVFNYADKPDLSVSEILRIAADELGVALPPVGVPYPVGLAAGYAFDLLSLIIGRPLPMSSVRVRKLCAETTVNTERLESTGFVRPYSLEEGLRRMIRAEFRPQSSAPLSEPA